MSKFDPAIEALMTELARTAATRPQDRILWLADEHPIDPAGLRSLPVVSLLFVSNRLDQCQLAEGAGISAHFDDFGLQPGNSAQHVFVRAPKERALAHHLINCAWESLAVDGSLWLFGYKNEGIKTHIARATGLFGSKAQTKKAKKQLSIARLTKQSTTGDLLPDDDYGRLRALQLTDGETYWSKPGIYGWNKIDRGSELLFAQLSEAGSPAAGSRILDIGCGYGYLSRKALSLEPARLVATDNCFGALEAARKNLEHPAADVVAANAGAEIEGEFDLILCNPPFHQGFGTSPELHRRFLANTRRLLGKNGEAWYVVNQFLPLEKLATETGLNVREVARESGFKILQLRGSQH